jgi:hypothetical protein
LTHKNLDVMPRAVNEKDVKVVAPVALKSVKMNLPGQGPSTWSPALPNMQRAPASHSTSRTLTTGS